MGAKRPKSLVILKFNLVVRVSHISVDLWIFQNVELQDYLESRMTSLQDKLGELVREINDLPHLIEQFRQLTKGVTRACRVELQERERLV